MTANAKGKIFRNMVFVGGIGVSISNPNLSVFDISRDMVFPRFFLMCVCISENWAFL